MDFISLTIKDAYGTEWRDVKDWVDYGPMGETFRGYNLEFKDSNNNIIYAPIIYVQGDLANNESVTKVVDMYEKLGHVCTGRCIFRGYFRTLLDKHMNERYELLSMEEVELLEEMKMEGTI